MESVEEKDFAKAMHSLPENGKKKTYKIDYFKSDATLIISIEEVVLAPIENEEPI